MGNISTEKAIAGWEVFINYDLFHKPTAECKSIINVVLDDTGWNDGTVLKNRGADHYKKMVNHDYQPDEYCIQNDLDGWIKRGCPGERPITHRHGRSGWRAV